MLPPAEACEKKTVYDRGARRREKSRDAARCRRQQESDTYNEICNVVPIPTKILAQMDRSKVMRLLVSFMKLRNVVKSVEFNRAELKHEDSSVVPDDEEYINALNGFIIVLSQDCDLLYISTNVKQYIGITSLDLIGQNLFGYTHEGDHGELTNCLKTSSEKTENHSFFMRMKSTLTSSRRNVNLKSATYKVLKCEGVVHHAEDPNDTYMVAYCEPIPHPANIEMVLDCNTFLSQHSLDMKFTFCDDERVSKLLGYSEHDMNGKSFYDFCHTEDIKPLDDVLRKLFRLGQVTTNQYRMLAKYGGYVWIISQATIINNPRNQQPSYVVCVNHVLSEVIDEHNVMAMDQLKHVALKQPAAVKNETKEVSEDQCRPLDCTEAIFCDSTDSIFCSTNSDYSTGLSDDSNTAVLPFMKSFDCLDKSSSLDADDLSDMFHVDSFENLCNYAPSIGDPKWTETMTNTPTSPDCLKDLCNNAPSIGDPQWNPVPQEDVSSMFSGISVNIDRVKGFLKEKYANWDSGRDQMGDQATASPYSYSPSASMQLTTTKRKVPRGGFQIVTVPKAQYERHVQFAPTKRQADVCGSMHKVNPPDCDYPPIKKSKSPALYSPSRSPIHSACRSVPGAAQLLLGGHVNSGKNSLTSLLLQPGHKCDNYSPEPHMDEWEQCSDRHYSRSPSESPKFDGGQFLPVLSLHDCEVNAPINENLSTVDWMALSCELGI